MKKIILDHFRRWWWVWVLGCIFHAALTVGMCIPNERRHQSMSAFPLGVFLGAFLLMMDLQRGHARALLAMPVTLKQVARAWWWAAVGLPAVALAVISGITFGIMCLITFVTHHQMPVIGVATNNWMANLFLLGVTFFAVTGMPARNNAGADWKQKVRGAFFGILYGGSIGGWMLYKDLDFTTSTGMIIFSIATILTVFGWFRAEILVMERAAFRPSSPAPGKKKSAPSRCAEGRGGMFFLIQSIFTRMIWMGLWMMAFVVLIFGIMVFPKFAAISAQTHGVVSADPFDFFGGGNGMVVFQFMWVMAFQIVVFAMHVRFLRTMPVSAAKLAGAFVFTPLVAMLVVLYASNLLVAAISHTSPTMPATMIANGCLLPIAIATTIPVLLIWRGIGTFTWVAMMLLLITGAFGAVFLKGQIPVWISLIAALLIIIGSFVAAKLILERSSTTYRPRAGQFGGWNLGGGR